MCLYFTAFVGDKQSVDPPSFLETGVTCLAAQLVSIQQEDEVSLQLQSAEMDPRGLDVDGTAAAGLHQIIPPTFLFKAECVSSHDLLFILTS